jgi:RNA polymerase primary sigma factor
MANENGSVGGVMARGLAPEPSAAGAGASLGSGHVEPSEGASALPSAADLVDEDAIKLWWRRVQTFPLLSCEREVELAKRIEAGDEGAFWEMVECNQRLVANIARKCRRFAGNSLQMSDLIQEGSVGLIRAVHKFDYRKGYKFSTYASYWIRQAVMRSIAEQGRSVRLPVHMVESVSRAERARVLLTQELQRAPSARELATYLQISERKVKELLERVVEPMSLDAGVGDEEESVLCDFIEDFQGRTPHEAAAHSALQGELKRALDALPEREAQVLTLRYGLDGTGTTRTLDEVGDVLQLTRERIRQIEKSAIKRLKGCAPLQETARCHSGFSRSGHTSALA